MVTPNDQTDRRTFGLGAGLVALFAAIAVLSAQLEKSTAPGVGPISGFIALYAAAGVLFLLAVRRVRTPEVRVRMTVILGVGLCLRGLMFLSVPILEDDYFRYFLDGAVTLAGENPYTYSPEAIADGTKVPAAIAAVGETAAAVIPRINHRTIRTIYPAVAQGVFALAHRITPFDITGLRFLLLLFDGATIWLILTLLTRLGKPRQLAIFYVWNPLVAKELINAGHMDAILLPFLAAALLFVLDRRFILAAAMITLAAGVKLWPVILMPVLFVHVLRTVPGRWERARILGLAAALFIATAALMAWPVWRSVPDDTSGFLKYGKHWRNNDAIYRLVMIPMQPITQWIGRTGLHAYNASRYLVSALYLVFVGALLARKRKDTGAVVTLWLLVIAALYVLSPTQFPWYFTWVIPILAIRGWPALELYTLTLPLYYFQHALPPGAGRWWFDHGIVWVEHLPVFLLIAVTTFKDKGAPLRYLGRGSIQ